MGFLLAFAISAIWQATALRATGKSSQLAIVKPREVLSQGSNHALVHAASSRHATNVSSSKVQNSTIDKQRQATVMLCIPARSAYWLKLLRAAWLDNALRSPQIAAMVFIPENVELGDGGNGLDVMRLGHWIGDKGTFQGAFTGAIQPCMAKVSATWYAMLDDDVIIDPPQVLQLLRTFDPNRLILYGRKSEAYCCNHILYGGFMLMGRNTAEKVVANMDAMYDQIAETAKWRRLGVYKGTHGFNIDHFFSIAVQLIHGTLREVEAIADMRPELEQNRGMPRGSIAVLHHVKEADLIDYVRHPKSLRTVMAASCYGLCR